jgi:hypothetical protein
MATLSSAFGWGAINIARTRILVCSLGTPAGTFCTLPCTFPHGAVAALRQLLSTAVLDSTQLLPWKQSRPGFQQHAWLNASQHACPINLPQKKASQQACWRVHETSDAASTA